MNILSKGVEADTRNHNYIHSFTTKSEERIMFFKQ